MDPFDALAAKFEPAIAAALLRAFQILRDRYTLDEISAVIQARGPGGVYDLLRGAEAVIAAELVPELEEHIDSITPLEIEADPAVAGKISIIQEEAA